MIDTDTPRIYVACLASYNAGKLHGRWIDATDEDSITALRAHRDNCTYSVESNRPDNASQKIDTMTTQTLDEFTAQYIETAIWPSMDELGDFLDANYGPDDLALETLETIIADCRRFQENYRPLIQTDLSQAGHDFWLTRNGHGAGFWDGGWPEHGKALTKASVRKPRLFDYMGQKIMSNAFGLRNIRGGTADYSGKLLDYSDVNTGEKVQRGAGEKCSARWLVSPV